MGSYKVSEPSALKFLKANGAVVDENGNVVSDASDYWKKVYDQAEPKVAKYLHADGTIDENPGSGGEDADLEDNKTATIDVSTYTEPVEIEPTEGKDGMKKVTITLSNIPSPSGSTTAYAWASGVSAKYKFLPVSVAPADASEFLEKCAVGGAGGSDGSFTMIPFATLYSDYTKVSDTEFTVSLLGSTQTFTRDSSKDFTLWQTA